MLHLPPVSSTSPPRPVRIFYELPPGTNTIRPEDVLASVSEDEAVILDHLPTVVHALALLLSALRTGALVEAVDIEPAPAKPRRRHQARAVALAAVRSALASEPGASLSRLAAVTGYSRAYVCTLRREAGYRPGQE